MNTSVDKGNLRSQDLVEDIRNLIESTRQSVATTINAGLTLLYWEIGKRFREDILRQGRAEYGKEILSTLSKALKAEYGQGFSGPNLSRMLRFVEAFPDRDVVVSLTRHLGWSHFVELLALKDNLQRDFYAEVCRLERWSVRTLRKKIQGMLAKTGGTGKTGNHDIPGRRQTHA